MNVTTARTATRTMASTLARSVCAALTTSRRAAGLLAMASALTLTACGSGTSIVSSLVPSRFIAFGDGFSDLGQTGGTRYTVNDATTNVWVQTLAASYGQTLQAQSAGGQGWARGQARIAQKPDAAGNAATLTVAEQIDAFLASSAIAQNDVTVVGGGVSDIVALTAAYKANTISAAQLLLDAAQAGKDLGAQVRRLVTAGGKHVVVTGVVNLGKTPYAIALTETALLSDASLKFNEALLVSIVDLGANALYIDIAFQTNLFVNSFGTYGFTNATAGACAVPVQTPCTPTTLTAGVDYTKYVFADSVYLSPSAHRQLGSYAYNKMKTRW